MFPPIVCRLKFTCGVLFAVALHANRHRPLNAPLSQETGENARIIRINGQPSLSDSDSTRGIADNGNSFRHIPADGVRSVERKHGSIARFGWIPRMFAGIRFSEIVHFERRQSLKASIAQLLGP